MSLGRIWLAALLALAGLSGFVTLVCVAVDMTAPQYDADPLFDYLVPRFLAGHIHDALTMAAVPHLSLPSSWAGIAPGPGKYEFILMHKLARWQTLASLTVLPAIWLVVAAVVRRLPYRIKVE